MKKIVFSLFSVLIFNSQLGLSFGAPEHSDVVAKSTVESDGTVSVELKVTAKNEYKITFDAPWELKIKKAEGVKFSQEVYKKKSLDEKLPGFKIKSEKSANKKGQIEYNLTAFICTKDKTRCYREVHKKTLSW